MTTYEVVSISLEATVVVILIVEFIYDAYWNSHEQKLKRRKKKEPKFNYLTTGEMR